MGFLDFDSNGNETLFGTTRKSFHIYVILPQSDSDQFQSDPTQANVKHQNTNT